MNTQHRADQQSLTDPGSFSMILLGDPQGYTKYDINQPILDLCMLWITDHFIDPIWGKAVGRHFRV